MIRRFFLFVPLFACAPALAQMIQSPGQPASGPYTHAASGLVFPVKAGSLQRFRMTQGPVPTAMNAGYLDPDRRAQLSVVVFVEPVEKPDADECRATLDAERQQARKTHADALLADLAVPAATSYSANGFSARYASADGRGATESYCYHAGAWRFLINFQHLASFEATGREGDFLRDLPLPPAEKH